MLDQTIKQSKYVQSIKKYHHIFKKSPKDNLRIFDEYDVYRAFLAKATDDLTISGIMLENPKYEYAELNEPDYGEIIRQQDEEQKKHSIEGFKFFE